MKRFYIYLLALSLVTLSACTAKEKVITVTEAESLSDTESLPIDISFTETKKEGETISEKTSVIVESSKVTDKQHSTKTTLQFIEPTKAVTTEPIISTTAHIPFANGEDAREIANIMIERINMLCTEQGSVPAIKLSGLTQYAEYRSRQLITNFAHDTKDERAAATALKYGQYVDPLKYGMTGEPYYTANAGEAIAKAGYVGTVENVAEKLALLVRNSPEHWAYVGSSEYRYIAVGITYNSGMWYCDVAVASDNSDLL